MVSLRRLRRGLCTDVVAMLMVIAAWHIAVNTYEAVRPPAPFNLNRLLPPVDDGFVHAVCTGHERKAHLGIVDQAESLLAVSARGCRKGTYPTPSSRVGEKRS